MTTSDTQYVKKAPVIRFRPDTTLRWSLRDGDSLIWLQGRRPDDTITSLRGRNSWNHRDGDSVLLTNRVVDIPRWFQLHPGDVCNAQCYPAEQRLKGSCYIFTAPMTGQNIWRVPAGDRLAWIGAPREGLEGKDGVLAVLDCEASMLVLGEPAGQKDSSEFGKGLNTKTALDEINGRLLLAFEAVYNLGVSRTMGASWRLGDGN